MSVNLESAWGKRGALSPHRESRRRLHRWFTLPSSLVLVVCLFLPTLKVCGKPTTPLEFPMFWTPYLVALLVFLAALAAPWRLLAHAIALRIVLVLTFAGWGL